MDVNTGSKSLCVAYARNIRSVPISDFLAYRSLEIPGTNAIIVYVLSEIVSSAIYVKIASANGTRIALRAFVYEKYFASWAGSLNGSRFYALAYLML